MYLSVTFEKQDWEINKQKSRKSRKRIRLLNEQ